MKVKIIIVKQSLSAFVLLQIEKYNMAKKYYFISVVSIKFS